MGDLSIDDVYKKIQKFFDTVSCDDNLQATYNRKLGSWMSDDETTSLNYATITTLFKSSLEFDDKVVKTWHLFALANYKRVKDVELKKKIEAGKKKKHVFEDVMESSQIKELLTDAF